MSSFLDIVPPVLFGLILALGLTACAEGTPQELSLGTATNQFGLDLFHEVHKQAGSEPNVIVSPTSAALALAMVHMGAGGETEAAMRQSLYLPDATEEQLATAYQRLLAQLVPTDTGIRLNVANSIWLNRMFEFNPDYLGQVNNCFEAELARLNFGDPSSRDRINNWVSEATNGRIEQIIDAIEPQLAMILINALYFKADWQVQFDTAQTMVEQFTLPDSTLIEHPLMKVTGSFAYAESPEYQMIELSYVNQEQSMYVLLPSDSVTARDLASRMTFDWWKSKKTQLERREGTLIFPRFTLTTDYILNSALKDMGMAIAFSPSKADFSPMLADGSPGLSQKLFISEVRQKTFIEVTETGTEAAAATSVGIRVTAVQPNETRPFYMRVDRPFIFVLMDNSTDMMLFVGQVGDPRQ